MIPAIAAKERIGKPLLDEVQIAREEIKPSIGDKENAVWGVVTWLNVPPETDFFLVQIRGLSNAYKVKIDAEGKKTYLRKTLQVHFCVPGHDFPKRRPHPLGRPRIYRQEYAGVYAQAVWAGKTPCLSVALSISYRLVLLIF